MGVGSRRPGMAVFLKPGEVVRVKVDPLGAIEDRVEASSSELLETEDFFQFGAELRGNGLRD